MPRYCVIGAGAAGISARIDIVRDVWLEQMADTERLLDAYRNFPAAKPAPHRTA